MVLDGIIPPKQRPPRLQPAISGPRQGSFSHVAHMGYDGKHLTATNVDPSWATALSTLPDDNIDTLGTADRLSPGSSISGPTQGSFTHVAHMGYDPERGFTMQGVDPSWQAVLNNLRWLDNDANTTSPAPRRRRLSESEITLPSVINMDRDIQPSSPPSNPDYPRAMHQYYPPDQHNDDNTARSNGAPSVLHQRQKSLDMWNKMRGHIHGIGPVTRSSSVSPGPRDAWVILEQRAREAPARDVPPSPNAENRREDIERNWGNNRTLRQPSPLSGGTGNGSLPPSARVQVATEKRGRVGAVRRKEVPKLTMDEVADYIQQSSKDSTRSERETQREREKQLPRPTARYFDDSPIDTLVFDTSSTSVHNVSPAREIKRREEVTRWREAMQKKQGLPEQQQDSVPAAPQLLVAPVLSSSLSAQDRILRCVKAALENDDNTELFLLPESDGQLAIDTVWEMLTIPPSKRPAIGDSTSSQRLKRTKLRRLSLKLVLQYDKMPAALFLKGVQCHDREAPVGGGFADVYCGTFRNARVALKCPRAFKMSSESAKANLKRAFYRESLLWQDLAHQHIVPFLGVSEGVFKHSICMVLPWLNNGSILNYMDNLKENGKLTSDNHKSIVNEWCYEVSLGLTYLHEEGIVHGDLRGSNILVDDHGSVRLTDFGMSVIAEGTGYNYGSVRGGAKRWLAPELISPEQFELGSSRPTYASDVYAFALTAVELYTGNHHLRGSRNIKLFTVFYKDSDHRDLAPLAEMKLCLILCGHSRPAVGDTNLPIDSRLRRSRKDLLDPFVNRSNYWFQGHASNYPCGPFNLFRSCR